MIEFQNVSRTFQQGNQLHHAVNDVSFSIPRGQSFGIIGQSGAGKSTLLRFINKLDQPNQGSVLVKGRDLAKFSARETRSYQKSVGTIFQHFNLLNNLTVAENILLPLQLHTYQNVMNLDDILHFVGLETKKHAYPRTLSGGQKQRVGIARALIIQPEILLCDEPTSALDEGTQLEIIDVLKQARQSFDMTMVIVSHQLNVIKELCQQAAFMENGHLVEMISIQTPQTNGPSLSYLDHVKEVLSHE